MFWLILGVLLWSALHLFPAALPAQRSKLINNLGEKPYMGLFALGIVLSLVLIVLGWRSTPVELLYAPPAGLRHLTMLLVLVAIILFGAANMPTRIRQFLRHPMLTGVAVWAFAHLLSNGETRSVVLFGGMLAWALISIPLINRRDGAYAKPATPALKSEFILLAGGVVIYLALSFLHPYFAGVRLF